MCKISPNLKLCTCAAKDPGTLKNYWVLFRPYVRDFEILGTTIMPFKLDFEDEKHNHKVLLNSLNSGDCFDVFLDIKEKDILEMHFNCLGNDVIYDFVFEHGKWEVTYHDPFGSVEEVSGGKIKLALIRV